MKPDRYRIGQAYGGSHARFGTDTGLREWEWVYVGRDFAREHAMGRLGIGVFLVIGAVVFHAGAMVVLALNQALGLLAVAAADLVIVWLLIRKAPVAYPLTFVPLALMFPFSVPFLVYWADGVRPNLIYRWRFERLVPEGEEVA